MTREEAKHSSAYFLYEFESERKQKCESFIDGIYDDFENRTCENCRYWQYENIEALAETCRFGNIEHSYQAGSFGCNKWKQK